MDDPIVVGYVCALFNPSFAQSALTDDAHTSTVPKSADSNFGINPNLGVSAAGNVYLKFKLSLHSACSVRLAPKSSGRR